MPLSIPAEIGAAVVAVVAAGCGYVINLLVTTISAALKHHRARRATMHNELLVLSSVLKSSNAVFLIQRSAAERLKNALLCRGYELLPDESLEQLFVRAYKDLQPAEQSLHTTVRAYTEHGLMPLNVKLLEWLTQDLTFRTGAVGTKRAPRFAHLLNALEVHLLLWTAKCRAWIPNHPHHALVYLADEEELGLGFPRGIDAELAIVLAEFQHPIWRRRAGPFPGLHEAAAENRSQL